MHHISLYANLWHMSENEVINNEDAKLYELGVNLISSLEEKVQSEFDKLKEIIKKHGGEVVVDSVPASIPLAYTMTKNIDSKNQKHNNASFGWIKFNATPDKIKEIKEDLDLNASILRYIILNTTAESNTSASIVAESLSKKSDTEGKSKRQKSDDSEEVEVDAEVEETVDAEVDLEEVDEAIEELVEEDK